MIWGLINCKDEDEYEGNNHPDAIPLRLYIGDFVGP
jgi:hypothetical protein